MRSPVTHPPATTDQPVKAPHAGSRRGALVARGLLGLGLIAAMALGGAWLMHASIDAVEENAARSGAVRHELLGDVKRWGYQLQGLDVQKASQSPFDLLVIDEDFPGRRRAASQVERQRALTALKRKPDGKRRLVLAYLSIGEAEDYRGYWDRKWVTLALAQSAQSTVIPAEIANSPAEQSPRVAKPLSIRPLLEPAPGAPSWLGRENTDWRGNFHVRYWDAGWQSHLLGNEASALDRIVAAGFDGVYLDRADAYMTWIDERPSAKQDMVSLIERISERARLLSPGFIVVMQNAEELLGQNRIRKSLDAVAKEDLLFGIDGAGSPNSSEDVSASMRLLKKAQGGGLPVLVVEYLDDHAQVAAARARLAAEGFIPYFASRRLDSLRSPD